MAANRSANCSPRRLRKGAGHLVALAVALPALAVAAENPADPWIDRIEPLGGTRGAAVQVELRGKQLSTPATLEFDAPGLRWEHLGQDGPRILRGIVHVDASTPPGPHIATLRTPHGRSNSRMFYVHEEPASREAEPNDTLAQAQRINLAPQTLHGAMHELSDIDVYAFEGRAGERWTFDLRSLEYGGFLENDMTLLSAAGERIAFNDDRDDYLETPFLEHVFAKDGLHYLKLDQYRGPQRVNCAGNCGYMLRIGQLPVVDAAHPLGARVGAPVTMSLRGRALEDVDEVWIAPARRAEYYRLTFPYTVPLRTGQASGQRLTGRILKASAERLEVRFDVPEDAWQGLWRLWIRSPGGATDSVSVEVSSMPEPDCREIRPSSAGAACHGVIEGDEAEHEYTLVLEPDQPLVVTTLSTQLGLPLLDTVLELMDDTGAPVAEHDDLMSGQGTVIGNPDSMLHYRSKTGGRYRLVVRDRIDRTGPTMAYRLRIEEREPRFTLLVDPSNLNARAGSAERIGILMAIEPGFDKAVEVWVDDPPPGLTATTGQLRSDQYFGPSGDGDNIVIPSVDLEVDVAADLPPGDYALRVLGRAQGSETTVEAITTLWIGPPRKRNDVRRPLEAVRLTVLAATDPDAASGAGTAKQR